LQVLFSLIVFTICNIGLIKYLRRSGRKKLAIVIAMIIFYFAAFNDALVGVGLYPFIYLFEYAFAGLMISMAMMLVGDFMDIAEEFEKVNRRLEAAVKERTKEVKALSGLLPICASCKKIRDDKGYWSQIETYLKAHSDATFSHGICPECQDKLYPELAQYRSSDQKVQ
ncbi:MAG: hypothetical protein M0036_17725, partial [Desulfobacteraceae bacterium]|nr:hypothetical protein [Desulfobacteraceae bacterium]